VFSLKVLLDDIKGMFTPFIKDKPISLEYHADISQPMIVSDYLRIKQIITNLMSNSIKYTDYGIVTFDMVQVLFGRRGPLVLRVKDTGYGFGIYG
jgi:signal transduction histidine kinase